MVGDRVIVNKGITAIKEKRGRVTHIRFDENGGRVIFWRVRFPDGGGCNIFPWRSDESIQLDIESIRDDKLNLLGI